MDDIIINKSSSIGKCIKRAREEFNNSHDFKNDYSAQDAAILNIVRACEQSIDLANHVVKLLDLGIPNNSSDAFQMLAKKGIIGEDLATELVKMTGFRNSVIHQYQKINLDIVYSVINKSLDDLLKFSNSIVKKKTELEILSTLQYLPQDDLELKPFIRNGIISCYDYYQKEKSQTSDFLNMWRKLKIIGAIAGYNSKFYRVSAVNLELFFSKEDSITKENKHVDLMTSNSQKINDNDLGNFIDSLRQEISSNF